MIVLHDVSDIGKFDQNSFSDRSIYDSYPLAKFMTLELFHYGWHDLNCLNGLNLCYHFLVT